MRDRNEWFKDVKRLMRGLKVETVGAMLMDSYSRWRTTGDVFSEMGENCDL